MPNAHFSTGKKIAFTAVMFLYINLVLTIFWILKPLKKSLFIGQYDGESTFKLPELLLNFLDLLLGKVAPGFILQLSSIEMLGSSAELLAKGMNLIIAFLIVLFLTLVTRLAKRQVLTYTCMGLVIAMTVYFAVQINNPSELTVWLFYWFGDLYISLMLAAFSPSCTTPWTSRTPSDSTVSSYWARFRVVRLVAPIFVDGSRR